MDNIRLYLEYWHKNAKGKIIRYRRYRSDSLLGNFFKFLYNQIGRPASFTSFSSINEIFTSPTADYPKDINGTDRSNFADFARAMTGTDRGIVVGSGTTPVTLEDFRLASPIPNGTGVGQLVYGTLTVFAIDQSLSNIWKYRISRIFTNQSTGDVTIAEVGLVANVYDADTLVGCLMARDVLPAPVTLAPNDATGFRYTIVVEV